MSIQRNFLNFYCLMYSIANNRHKTKSKICLKSTLRTVEPLCEISELLHDRGPYHIETSPLIGRAINELVSI